ncbi:glycerophosphodiester phosphodiesterase, partial [Enterococcus faecium]
MTMITAHSGSDNTEENSWAFLRFCLYRQLCFDVDVRRQTDGTLILAH